MKVPQMKIPQMRIPKIEIKKLDLNALSRNLPPEQSTHYHTARLPNTDGLGYTFRAHKEKVTTSKKDSENYLYDLQKTFHLNFNMISEFLPTTSLPSSNKEQLNSILTKILSLIKKREQLFKDKLHHKMKILVDTQILEETKRSSDENNSLYHDKLIELKENVKKKKTLIKKIHKKFNEVETYIQRECLKFPKWKKVFHEFEVIPFLCDNEHYQNVKGSLYTKIKELDINVRMILKENIELKKREEYIQTEEELHNVKNNKLKTNVNCITEGSKYNELVKLYTLKNKYLTTQKEVLFNLFEKAQSQMHVNIVKNNLIKNLQKEEENGTKQEEVSCSYGDMCLDTLQSKNNLEGKKINQWDISCIENEEE